MGEGNRAKGENKPLHREEQRRGMERLAQSREAARLLELLGEQGNVGQAARAAAGGDSGPLMSMVKQLMRSKEGTALVESLERQAKKNGLT